MCLPKSDKHGNKIIYRGDRKVVVKLDSLEKNGELEKPLTVFAEILAWLLLSILSFQS